MFEQRFALLTWVLEIGDVFASWIRDLTMTKSFSSFFYHLVSSYFGDD